MDSQNLVAMPSGLPAFLPPVDEEPESSSEALVEEALAEKADSEGKIDGVACTSASFESALTSAFNRTDEEFGKADNAALVGTTAVVALVGSRQLYVANCGMPQLPNSACQKQDKPLSACFPHHSLYDR